MTNEKQAFVGFGANLGHREGTLRRAKALLDSEAGIRVIEASPLYQSEAHVLNDETERLAYLNAVAKVRTQLDPEALLEVCLRIERQFGRDRRHEARWAPRLLDLDVLVYEAITQQTETLVIPHPRIHERLFVLQPFVDIAPDLMLPAPYNTTVAALLAQCTDATAITQFSTIW